MALVAGMILAGALLVLGLVLWAGWGKRKVGVSLLGAGVFLAFLVVMLPTLGIVQMMPVMGRDELIISCFRFGGV